jgi:fatty acid synthase subunit beta
LVFIWQDSLWAAEDIEAVFDQDPQRVCILQGPVAVKHSKVKDEPIKDLLGNINSSLIDKLISAQYGGDISKIPTIDYLAAKPTPIPSLQPSINEVDGTVSYKLDQSLPETASWLETIAGPELHWFRALLTSTIVVQGSSYIDNPIRRLLAPRPGQQVNISFQDSIPTAVTVLGAIRSYGTSEHSFKAVNIKYNPKSRLIDVTVFENRRNIPVPLHLQFEYRPSMPFSPVHEVAQGRNTRIKQFYWKLWYGDREELPEIDVCDTFVGPEVVVDASTIKKFCAVGQRRRKFQISQEHGANGFCHYHCVAGLCRIRDSLMSSC